MKKSQNQKPGRKAPKPKIQPSKASSSFKSKPPKIQTTKNGKTITHEEIIGTINGEADFTVASYETNPGRMAPWLANESAGWEQYDYTHLEFKLTSQRGELNDGKVMVAPDYNVYDAAPEDAKTMGSYQNYAQCKITEHMSVPINLSSFFSSTKKKFVRASLGAGDLRQYDGCTLFVATEGCSNPGVAALTLSVRYTVRLYTPETEAKAIPPQILDVSNNSSETMQQGFSNPLTLNSVRQNGISAVRTGSTWRIPSGFYSLMSNASIQQFGGTENEPVWSRIQVLVNGVEAAASYAGGYITRSTTTAESQLENTAIGCLNVSDPQGADLQFLLRPDSSLSVPAVLNFAVPALASRLMLIRQGNKL